jgi:hypothetical protein
MNQLGYGRILIENPADALQFPGLGVIGSRVHQRQLFFCYFRALGGGPFLNFDSDIG